MPAQLAIDYGAGYTKAVLVWPSGEWTVLRFDGGSALSNAVHVSAGSTVVGAAAWRQAEVDPDGFVLAPVRAGTGPAAVGGVEVEVGDLVAATLRQVAAEATRIAGDRIEDVRLVVPAGWGPRRRTWFRHAVGKAGLGQPRLVEAPIAAMGRFDARAERSERSVLLVVDVGCGCEVSVLRVDAAGGVEVLSTLADPDLGGDRVDAGLAAAVTGTGVAELPAGQRWSVLASARTAKHALAEQVAVAMPLPGSPPMVVNGTLVRQAAQPVLERVGELAGQAVENADLTLADVDAVYGIGATMAMPGAAEMIAGKLGTVPQVVDQPALAAVLGAANAAPSPPAEASSGAAVSVRLPPLRRLLGLLLPGVVSLLLYGHFVFAAEFNNGTPSARTPHYYVLASWGELAVAATLALLACLQASALLAAVAGQQPTRAGPPGMGAPPRVSTGIGVAVAVGLGVAGLYAVTAAVFFAQPVGGPLRWAVLPILPTVFCAAVLAVVAVRRPAPAGGWDAFLAFPASATIAVAVGTLAVTGWWYGTLPAVFIGWEDTLGYLGGALFGIATAFVLVRLMLARIVVTLLLGFFSLIISRSGPGILAVIFALAVGVWCGSRAWTLARAARAQPARRSPSGQATGEG